MLLHKSELSNGRRRRRSAGDAKKKKKKSLDAGIFSRVRHFHRKAAGAEVESCLCFRGDHDGRRGEGGRQEGETGGGDSLSVSDRLCPQSVNRDGSSAQQLLDANCEPQVSRLTGCGGGCCSPTVVRVTDFPRSQRSFAARVIPSETSVDT